MVKKERSSGAGCRGAIAAMVSILVYLTLFSYAEAFQPQVSAGYGHTVGLKSDGTVLAVGDDVYGQCAVSSWNDIVQVAAGGWHTVGLKADGTVVAVGYNPYGQCDVGSWSGITQVAAGRCHTVGLKADGTVVAVGENDDGQLNVGSMTDIVQVSAGRFHTVGLKSDGTVVAVGANNYNYGQTDVGSWSGITQVAAGITHTVGLRSNGMVVAVGENLWGQSNVGSWNGIIQVAAGESHTVGLSSDGTVVAAGDNLNGQLNIESWTEITHVAAGFYHTVGLKADGNVVAVGADNFINYGQTNVGSWNLQGKPIPDIRAKGFNGPIWVSATTPLSVTVSLDPGNFTGYKAEWWIGAKTPFGWYSYVYPAGWEPGIHLCIQKPLFNLSSFEVFNRTLPPGDYTFYYVLDGQLNGQLDTTRLDSVQVHVQE